MTPLILKSTAEYTHRSEAQIRDWIRSQDDPFSWHDIAWCMQVSQDEAKAWIDFFMEKGSIEVISYKHPPPLLYRFRKPLPGGPFTRPRSADRPDSCHEDIVTRGAPVVKSVKSKTLPQHVRKVKPHLAPEVRIEKKGNQHIFFYLGENYTWTSHSPKNKDDEYDQLVRRLKTEGMWVE